MVLLKLIFQLTLGLYLGVVEPAIYDHAYFVVARFLEASLKEGPDKGHCLLGLEMPIMVKREQIGACLNQYLNLARF